VNIKTAPEILSENLSYIIVILSNVSVDARTVTNLDILTDEQMNEHEFHISHNNVILRTAVNIIGNIVSIGNFYVTALRNAHGDADQ
jgi:hypothetical protein